MYVRVWMALVEYERDLRRQVVHCEMLPRLFETAMN